VREAEFQHRIDLSEITPRSKNLKEILKRYVSVHMTESEIEALFLELMAVHDIPLPQTQVEYPPYRADFVWHDVGLIVETDGYQGHGGRIAHRDDLARDRHLKAATGYEVIQLRLRGRCPRRPGDRERGQGVARSTGATRVRRR
jgi:very-short-patch-repair endonuclease